MPVPAHRSEPFIYYIVPPIFFRIIPLAISALFISIPAGFLVLDGLQGVSARFSNYPELWWLVLMLAGSIVLLWRMAFPPRRVQARLEVGRDGVVFVPSVTKRRFFGESVAQADITPQSIELLLCHSYLLTIPDGYRVIVRDASEQEREIRVRFLTTLNADICRKIAEGITSATGLPVRLVIRRRLADGTDQETPWAPTAAKEIVARGFAMIAIASVPYIGGFAVGYFLPGPATIAAIGVALWLGQTLAVYGCARWYGAKTKNTKLYAITTVFTFAAAYGIAGVAGSILSGHKN
jgi:hypothetical protein